MSDDLILAIDLGTSSAKAGFIGDGGELFGLERRAHSRWRSPGSVRQDPDAWWRACRQAVEVAAARVDIRRVRAICAVGLAPTVVCIDEHGGVVGDAPTWADHSAETERTEVVEQLGPVLFPDALAQLRRLRRTGLRRAGDYARARWVLQSYELIAYRLTGELATITPYPGCRPWSIGDLRALDVDAEMLPPRRCLPGEVIGTLVRAAADELGLPCGIPVVAGTVDSFAAWLGTAILEPGNLSVAAGTSSCAALVCRRPPHDAQRRVSAVPHLTGTNWVLTAPLSSGGVFLEWLTNQLGGECATTTEDLFAEAKKAPAGANGVVALPFLLGERSPVREPHARGVIYGLAPWHTRGDIARAVLESIAFAVGQMCEIFEELGEPLGTVRLSGGLAQSPLWAQIVADTLGRPVEVPRTVEAGLIGAAALARVGTGSSPSLEQAARSLVRIETRTDPNEVAHQAYQERGELSRHLWRHVREDLNIHVSPRRSGRW